jgi:hypothetical protein
MPYSKLIKVHFPYKDAVMGCMGERMWVERLTETTGRLWNTPFDNEFGLKLEDIIEFKMGTDSPYAEFEFVKKLLN